MRNNTVIATLFLAGVVLATLSTELRRDRRQAGARRTLRPQNVTNDLEMNEQVATGNVQIEYSGNWAGLVLRGSNYTSVTGTIVVPTPKAPPGADEETQYAASTWVGIDGNTCQSAILQTGVDFYIQGGRVSFDGWYQWHPDHAYRFDSFRLGIGHTIQMTVNATTSSSGRATLKNISTGQSVSHSFSRQTIELCETNAEWIVEDFLVGHRMVPLIDFTTVTFTGASAVTGGTMVDTTGGTILNMKQKGQVLTSCTGSGNVVSCTHT